MVQTKTNLLKALPDGNIKHDAQVKALHLVDQVDTSIGPRSQFFKCECA